jgi:hypothetical protein
VAVVVVPSVAQADEADRLAASDRVEDISRAVALYETRLAGAPEDIEARLAAAIALNKVMAIRTNGNLPLVDGLQDTDARKAQAAKPQSGEAAAALANAYMFHASSLGIIQSILRGASGEYREHATRLATLDPAYDDGLGDYLLASFYLVAPWPVGDDDAALTHYERAARHSPESVRNQYGLGRLFCTWMKQESRRVLEELAAD